MGILGKITLGRVQERPRHPEVHQERTTRLEPNNQILAAPVERGDPLSLQLGDDLQRLERTYDACVEDVDTLEAASDERRLEPAADDLDLGELGHPRTVAARRKAGSGRQDRLAGDAA